MSFVVLYFIIPSFLFFLRPIKNNSFFVLYAFFVFTFSYDNVTDYEYFYSRFREVFRYGKVISDLELKQLEVGWEVIYKLFSFSKYGYVLLHIIVNASVILYFIYLSKKQSLLNVSIFLFFILNIISTQDNTMRQNPAIILGMYGFYLVAKSEQINRQLITKLLLITLVSMLFHYSAFLLIAFYFFVNWLKKTSFNLYIVFFIVIGLSIIRATGLVNIFVSSIGTLLSVMESNYASYYSLWMENQELISQNYIAGILVLMSIVPLVYFKLVSPNQYESNQWIKLSVNICVIWFSWTYFLSLNVLTRVMEYFSWFMIWGWGYMFKDFMFCTKKIALKHVLVIGSFAFFSIYHVKKLNMYYGSNHYLSVFSEECINIETYNRSILTINGENRIRISR